MKNLQIPFSLHHIDETADCPTDSANLFLNICPIFLNRFFFLPLKLFIIVITILIYLLIVLSFIRHFNGIRILKNNFSNGSDGVSVRLLYNCRHSIAYLIFLILSVPSMKVPFMLFGKPIQSPLFLKLVILMMF